MVTKLSTKQGDIMRWMLKSAEELAALFEVPGLPTKARLIMIRMHQLISFMTKVSHVGGALDYDLITGCGVAAHTLQQALGALQTGGGGDSAYSRLTVSRFSTIVYKLLVLYKCREHGLEIPGPDDIYTEESHCFTTEQATTGYGQGGGYGGGAPGAIQANRMGEITEASFYCQEKNARTATGKTAAVVDRHVKITKKISAGVRKDYRTDDASGALPACVYTRARSRKPGDADSPEWWPEESELPEPEAVPGGTLLAARLSLEAAHGRVKSKLARSAKPPSSVMAPLDSIKLSRPGHDTVTVVAKAGVELKVSFNPRWNQVAVEVVVGGQSAVQFRARLEAHGHHATAVTARVGVDRADRRYFEATVPAAYQHGRDLAMTTNAGGPWVYEASVLKGATAAALGNTRIAAGSKILVVGSLGAKGRPVRPEFKGVLQEPPVASVQEAGDPEDEDDDHAEDDEAGDVDDELAGPRPAPVASQAAGLPVAGADGAGEQALELEGVAALTRSDPGVRVDLDRCAVADLYAKRSTGHYSREKAVDRGPTAPAHHHTRLTLTGGPALKRLYGVMRQAAGSFEDRHRDELGPPPTKMNEELHSENVAATGRGSGHPMLVDLDLAYSRFMVWIGRHIRWSDGEHPFVYRCGRCKCLVVLRAAKHSSDGAADSRFGFTVAVPWATPSTAAALHEAVLEAPLHLDCTAPI